MALSQKLRAAVRVGYGLPAPRPVREYDEEAAFAEFEELTRPSDKRFSDSIRGVDAAGLEQLHVMVERFGVRAVLRSLRECCDSRCVSAEYSADLEDLIDDDSPAWRRAGDALERIVLSDEVNVK